MSDTADIDFEARWKRRASNAWTTRDFRAPFLAFARAELGQWGWVADWEIEERIASNSISIRVPTVTPVQPPPPAHFQVRDGFRYLVIAVTRARDKRRFEVGLTFPSGAGTSSVEIATLIDRGRQAIIVQNRSTL